MNLKKIFLLIVLTYAPHQIFSAELYSCSDGSNEPTNSIQNVMFSHCKKPLVHLQAFLENQKRVNSSNDFEILINSIDSENGRTMLRKLVRFALHNGGDDLKKLKLFVSYKPNPHAGEDTPLHAVLFYYYQYYRVFSDFERCVEVMNLLKSIGQDFNQLNAGRDTELEFAVKFMMNHGTPFNVVIQMVEKLLEYGADPTLSNYDFQKWSVMDLVYMRSHDAQYNDLYQLFLKYGFKPSYSAVAEAFCTIM